MTTRRLVPACRAAYEAAVDTSRVKKHAPQNPVCRLVLKMDLTDASAVPCCWDAGKDERSTGIEQFEREFTHHEQVHGAEFAADGFERAQKAAMHEHLRGCVCALSTNAPRLFKN